MKDGSNPPLGGGDEGGRVGGCGDRNNLDTVHGRAIYCDAVLISPPTYEYDMGSRKPV